MDIVQKTVKRKRAAESAESHTPPKTAKTLQLNAANAKDPTKHGTINAQLER
jgi:hypothetical protein